MLPVESLHSLVCSSAWDENKGLRVHGLTRPGRIQAKTCGSCSTTLKKLLKNAQRCLESAFLSFLNDIFRIDVEESHNLEATLY